MISPSLQQIGTMTQQPFRSPREIKNGYPLTESIQRFIDTSRQRIREALKPDSDLLILLIGPCSIHDVKGAKEYALKLKTLAEQTTDRFLIVMRVYLEKPRTALGWKGLLHDPFLDGSHRIEEGLIASRELLLHLAALGLPAACEFLDPISYNYFGDLISWGCIGARTSTSQVHRQLASFLPMPTAFKNSTDGNVENAVNGCLYASQPHTFLGMNEEGNLSLMRSKGNPDTHIVLRGGDGKTNYDAQSITHALHLLKKMGLPEGLIVDCSHGNADKKHEKQMDAFRSVMAQIKAGNKAIRGLMLESYLEEGNQPHHNDQSALKFGISITDPCLGWVDTENLVLDALR